MNAPWRWFRRGALAVLFVLSVAPLAWLIPATFSQPEIAIGALSARRLGLLVRSVDLALVVAAITTALGMAAAAWTWTARPRTARIALGIGIVGLFVPPAAHAAAWASLTGTTTVHGLVATAVAQVTAFLPLAFLVAWAGFSALSRDAIDAARTLGSDTRAVYAVGLGAAAAAAAVAAAIVALTSLGDYAVASTFSVDTFAMDVFAEYAANGPGNALAVSWPLVALGVLVVLAISGPFASLAERSGGTDPVWPTAPHLGAPLRATLLGSVGVLMGAAVLVVGALFVGTQGPATALRALASATPDLLTTAWVALVAAAICGAIALVGGVPPAPGRPLPTALFGLAVGAIVMPPPVVGAGLIAMWNHSATAVVYDSSLMPVLASCARFAPLAMLVVAVAAGRLDRSTLETSLVSATPARAARTVVMPQLRPAAIAASLIVVALAAGELGATIMVLQPGSSTATVRAYNLLHYGAAPDVAAIALAVAAGGAACALAATWLLAHQPSNARRRS